MDSKQTFILAGVGLVSLTVVITMGVTICKVVHSILSVDKH